MKKRVLVVVFIILIVVIVFGYFSYKSYFLYHYDTSDVNSFYQKFMKLIENKESYSVHTKLLDDKEYFSYYNFKLKNVFSEYVEEYDSSNLKIYSFSDEENIELIRVSFFRFSKPFYLTSVHGDKGNIFSMKRFMQQEKLDNVLDLFDYLYLNREKKVNIFDSISTIKNDYAIKSIISSIVFGDNFSNCKLTYLNGDYIGYIQEGQLNDNEGKVLDTYEVHIFFDDKEYGFAFMTKDARVDRKYILELIDTIVIE